MKPYSLRGMTRPFAGCALSARCMRAACALHARAIRSARQQHAVHSLTFFKTCALYALCMRTAYVQCASNTLCMRCQLASFFQILTKVRRTTTHWPYFSFFYVRTVRRVGVTGPLRRGLFHSLWLFVFVSVGTMDIRCKTIGT